MNPDASANPSQRQLDALLSELLDLDPAAREARLAELPPEQGRRLAALLAAALDDDDFLTPGGALQGELIEAALREESALVAGCELGPWRIVREIGAGGMGRVYLAERADGLFDRQVAIKLVHVDGAATSLARVQREQRLLAALVHPHIARLYDAGVTDDGAPYLVMEHVDGEPIDVWSARRGLDARQRIGLVMEVCAAVEAAHRQLIVHRDIKPSNVLVDTAGQVKLLDFGIAGMLDTEEAGPGASAAATQEAATAQTEVRAFHTPRYASPEQRAGEATTTASDVYQIGLLLRELLHGRQSQPAADGDARLQAVGDGACAGVPEADLQAILAKALADDPARRYASADRLREDLEHLLAGRPVSARSAGAAYRLRRLVGRHRMASTAIAVATLLLIGTVTVFTVRLANERDATRLQAEHAERARIETEQVVAFLTDLFRGGDPYGPTEPTPVAELSARALLDQSAGRLEHALNDQPLVRARLLDEVARIYRLLGLLDESEPLVRESLRLRDAQPQLRPIEGADTALALGRTLTQRGAMDEAAPLIARAERTYREAGEERRLDGALEAKGNLLLTQDDPAAIDAFKDSLALWRAHGEVDRQVDLHLYLANALATHADLAEARAHREAALALVEARFGPAHPAVATALVGLADQYKRENDPALGVPLLERALTIFEAHFGRDDFRVAKAVNNLGIALSDLGNHEAARPHLERALLTYRSHRPDHPGTILNNLGTVEWASGRPEDAAERYREALAQLAPRLRDDHVMIALVETNLGEALFAMGAHDDARHYLQRGVAHLARRIGDGHVMLVPSLEYLAQILEAADELDRAEALWRRVLAI
ncbi:MAG TPA: tetratricopeptide repeat protein, partial [Xanthomonadaceae bacterium]|nr:tetratricopeptide repeat protein [Xanthomonadaceae bacterium]